MNCPVCQKLMSEKDFGAVHVDVCSQGCKSMWFDWFELQKLDEKNEGFGQALQDALHFPRSNDAHRSPLKCPKCQIPMRAHKYQSSKEVNVDECYQCGGFFLDSGELNVIRESYMSEKEEAAYLQKLLAEVPDFQTAKQDADQNKKRGEALRHYTRFLRLSYYITGR